VIEQGAANHVEKHVGVTIRADQARDTRLFQTIADAERTAAAGAENLLGALIEQLDGIVAVGTPDAQRALLAEGPACPRPAPVVDI